MAMRKKKGFQKGKSFSGSVGRKKKGEALHSAKASMSDVLGEMMKRHKRSKTVG